MHDEEFLDLFKPKDPGHTTPSPESQDDQAGDAMGATQPSPAYVPLPNAEFSGAASHQDWEVGDEVESPFQGDKGEGCTWRIVGVAVGGGCLLLILLAVLVFALAQFWPWGDDDDSQPATLTPTTSSVAPTPLSTAIPVTESPLVVPVVSSGDVRVPIAVPEHLTIGEATFAVEAVRSPASDWPDAPAAGDVAAWAYGTVINYILRLSPTPENQALLSELQVADSLYLHMSTGLILNFSVHEITSDIITDSATLLRQASPRLTLALFPGDDTTAPTVVSAAFYDDESSEQTLPTGAVAGLVGTPVDQGPVRVTVLEAYQVAAAEAGLPGGTGYLLIDLAVENIGTAVLETEYFQSFVSDAAGERYPLTIPAGQFTHYGLPVAPLAPGEKVIGSVGYLVPDGPGGQVHWVFNPLPGSEHWVVVPLAYDLPASTPTPEPPQPVGFARVTVDPEGVFVDHRNDLLVIGLEIENISGGVVTVTENDVSLTSSGGEFFLDSTAPLLPWTIESGDDRLFELYFELPFTNDALLDVLGYTFSIDNIGGE